MTTTKSIDTRAVHAGAPEPRIDGAVATPIFQSSTYIYGGETDYHDNRYVRLNNSPNHLSLHRALADLEEGEAALVTASGMAAISTALLAVLSAGDHLLAIDSPYGGTRNFLTEDLPRFGVECTFIDAAAPDTWPDLVRPSTKAIYVESITNPLMEVPDLRSVVRFAKERSLVSMIDNTIASPFNFRPLSIGFDLSLHSATKYLNGHTDVAAGAVIGRADLLGKINRLCNHLGGTLDPHACFLLQRGIKTLALRLRQQNASGLAVARFLDAHPSVAYVNYPGLPSHASHGRAADLFDGFGGMMSFELVGGTPAAEALFRRLRLPLVAVSLGGVETLIIRPAITAYAGVPAAERERLGVTDGLIRLSVGIESADELIADLAAALAAILADLGTD